MARNETPYTLTEVCVQLYSCTVFKLVMDTCTPERIQPTRMGFGLHHCVLTCPVRDPVLLAFHAYYYTVSYAGAECSSVRTGEQIGPLLHIHTHTCIPHYVLTPCVCVCGFVCVCSNSRSMTLQAKEPPLVPLLL